MLLSPTGPPLTVHALRYQFLPFRNLFVVLQHLSRTFSRWCLASPTKCEKPTRLLSFHSPLFGHLITSRGGKRNTLLLITTGLLAPQQSERTALKFWCDQFLDQFFHFSVAVFTRSTVLCFEMSSHVNCVLSALSYGSSGMQLGNLLSVFHILWHVYDPNKFRADVNFSSFMYKFIAVIILAFIIASHFFPLLPPLVSDSRKTRFMCERVCGKFLFFYFSPSFTSNDDNFSSRIRTKSEERRKKSHK